MSMSKIMAVTKRQVSDLDESGQTLVEYGLILTLVAMVGMLGVVLVAGSVDSMWSYVGDQVSNAIDSVVR